MSVKGTHNDNFGKFKKTSDSQASQLSEAQMLRQLQDILLYKDRKALEDIKETLEKKELLSEKVTPIIEEHLAFMKQNFPIEFERSVEKIIDSKIKNSQEELLNVIYPKLGKMTQKYIHFQFQQLKESIDEQIARTLNTGLIGKIRRMLYGIKVSDEVLSAVDRPIIEEIYVIQRDSGLLIGSASMEQKIHEDVVAGMLTAIKAFAEDAFQREQADLELIQYDAYRISLQNFPSYYIALVLGGSMSSVQKEKLSNEVLTFAEKEMNILVKDINLKTNLSIKKKLQEYFIFPQLENKMKRH